MGRECRSLKAPLRHAQLPKCFYIATTIQSRHHRSNVMERSAASSFQKPADGLDFQLKSTRFSESFVEPYSPAPVDYAPWVSLIWQPKAI